MTGREALRFLDDLIAKIRRAWSDAVRGRLRRVRIDSITQAVDARDIDRIVREAMLSQADLSALVEVARRGFVEAAIKEAQDVRVSWAITNPVAEAWLAQQSSRLIVEITASQREAVMQVLEAGFRAGQNPRSIALDIVGRVVGGKRQGGIVGLTSQQAGWVTNAAADLRSITEPESLARYLSRAARDRRFDASVMRAARTGKPLTQKQIDRIVTRYSDRLLKYRGDTIARTEALRAMSAGRYGAVEQAIATGELLPQNVVREWSATMDKRTRDSHAAMDGQEVRGDEPFITPDGEELRFPGDPDASAAESINCRCMVLQRIDFAAEAARGEG